LLRRPQGVDVEALIGDPRTERVSNTTEGEYAMDQRTNASGWKGRKTWGVWNVSSLWWLLWVTRAAKSVL